MDKPTDPVAVPTPTTPVVDPTVVPQTQTPAPVSDLGAPANSVPAQPQDSVGTIPPSSTLATPSVAPTSDVGKVATTNPPPQPSTSPPPGQQSYAPRKEVGAVGETKPAESVGQPNWAEADRVAKEENDEYWEKFASEIEAEKKVAELGGMEKLEKGEAVVSPQLAEEMGVKPVTPPEAVTDKSAFSVRGVSFSDEQISIGMKASTATGIRWLVEWFVLQLRKAHFHIKKTWGGVVERSL